MAAENGKMTDDTTEEVLPPPLPPTDDPELDRLSIIQWEWGEPEYRWFEIVTGESIKRE
jgi:hypothetical protein